jgi:hypothetical protein
MPGLYLQRVTDLDEQLIRNQLLRPARCEGSFGINVMNDSRNVVAGTVAVETPDPARFSFQDALWAWTKSKVWRSGGESPTLASAESMHC